MIDDKRYTSLYFFFFDMDTKVFYHIKIASETHLNQGR